MKNIVLFAFILFLFTQSSCVSYLTPALGGGTSINYIPRPSFTDTVKNATTVSVGYSYGKPFDGHLEFQLGQLSLKSGYTLNNINFGFGLFGIAGKANFIDKTIYSLGTNTPIGNFEKSIFGGGLNTTVGYQIHSGSKKITFRVINWENAFSIEKGDYLNFREKLYPQNVDSGQTVLFVSQLSKIYTTGFSTEIFFNQAFNEKDLKLGFRYFMGFSPRYSRSYRAINRPNTEPIQYRTILSGSFIANYKKFFFLAEYGKDANFLTKTSFGYIF
jgi:hypothetical protein